MERLCLKCKSELIGRSDKKFCNSSCKNIYNNQNGWSDIRKERYENNKVEILKKISNYNLRNRNKYILTKIKAKAKRLNIKFNLELSDINIPTHCPLLGTRLSTTFGRKDNTPSLDRKDNDKGYVKGNIWIISWRANRLKANLTKDELISFCTVMLTAFK